MDDFYKENKVEEQQETIPEVIKVGDKEYSSDELNRLVGLGQQAADLESRWDTKIDRLMPEYTRSREELKTLKQQQEEATRSQTETRQTQGEELSDAEQARLIRDNAKKYGLMTQDDFDNHYANRRAGEKLLEQTESVISKASTEEKPKVSVEELLTYMAETGIKKPDDAYELMFKPQLREIEMKKLQSIRPQGLYTESGSTAGSKTPAPVVVTKDNLGSMLDAVLTRGGGQ